jgi:hypothetical protein
MYESCESASTLLVMWFTLRGVRLLAGKVIQVRRFDHGALPAPWFFVMH